MLSIHSDDYFMKEAFREATFAAENGEVPVGAVIVCDNRIIARGSNRTEQLGDITAHAEIIAITAAADFLGSKYLTDCTLFVTLEPCSMCAGANGDRGEAGERILSTTNRNFENRQGRGVRTHLVGPALAAAAAIAGKIVDVPKTKAGM